MQHAIRIVIRERNWLPDQVGDLTIGQLSNILSDISDFYKEQSGEEKTKDKIVVDGKDPKQTAALIENLRSKGIQIK